MAMNRAEVSIEALRRKMVIAGMAGLHDTESVSQVDTATTQDAGEREATPASMREGSEEHNSQISK